MGFFYFIFFNFFFYYIFFFKKIQHFFNRFPDAPVMFE